MRKYIFTLVLMAFVFPVPASADKMTDLYFAGDGVKLSKQEKAAVALAEQWKGAGVPGSGPMRGPNGAIRFLYGAQQPSIVCAVLQLTDIALQPGEQVNSINLGDTARWTIEPAITGAGASEVQHLIIKPLDVGLETALVVTTNRRTYHIRLRSHRTKYMPAVSFVYPEEAVAKWEKIKTREVKDREDKTMDTGEYMNNLNFEYDIEGDASWKPLRVYNDGVKTIINMPKSMTQTEAPALVVVRKEGGIFKSADTVMVNYRVQGDRYVVDTLFDKAYLIAGVGSDQDKILIKRRVK